MTSRRLGLLVVLAALPLTGCEKLCSQGAVTWCPRSEEDELNNAPYVNVMEARIEAGIDPGAERLTAVFRAVAGDPDEDPIAYEWDLDGDGEFDKNGPLVSHSYHRSARPKVTLRVTDFPRKLGAPGDKRRTKVVAIADLALNHAPTADIGFPVPYPGSEPLYVGEEREFRELADDPDADALEFRWRLGDGRSEATPNPRVAYDTPGLKRISLHVTDSFGASAIARTEPNVVRRPTAAFAATPESPRVGEEVTFDGSASSSPNGPITRYDWDVHWSSEHLEACCGRTERLTFAVPGAHVIYLRVRDSQGGEAEASRTIFVRPAPGGNLPPSGRIAWTPQNPRIGQEVTFDATASRDPDGQIVRYLWDFDGNGNPQEGIGPTATWTFRSGGEHTIGLYVEDDDGAGDIATRKIIVDGPPTATFTVTPPAPFVGQQVTLDATGSSDPEGPIARYEWDLDGNGSFETDNGPQPIRTTSYATPGERFVRLRVTDAGGATATAGRTVLVRPASSALVHAARAQRVTPLAFSAQLDGRPLLGRRAQRQRSGRRLSLLGVLGQGRLRARVPDRPGPATRAERAVRRFLAAPWRTRVSFTHDRRTRQLSARAVALATTRGRRRSAACLQITIVARPGATPTGRMVVLGGTRAGARLHARASFRFRIERDGSATAVGRLRAHTGPKRPLPRSCRRLPPR
jgi:PKD repeat protein